MNISMALRELLDIRERSRLFSIREKEVAGNVLKYFKKNKIQKKYFDEPTGIKATRYKVSYFGYKAELLRKFVEPTILQKTQYPIKTDYIKVR